MAQVRASIRRPKGRRWTTADKALALSLLHSSPRSYRILRRVFFLPSVKTLKKTMLNLNIYPGFSDIILSALKKKVEKLPAASKLVCLAIDEMSIKEGLAYDPRKDFVEGFVNGKELANHALAFVVRGLIHQWKQPFGYFLSSAPMKGDELKSLLVQAITKLTSIGLNVILVVSDQGSNNQNLYNTQLKVSEEKPYFYVNDKKIFVMYDPPHLLKSVRNNLHSHGFEVDGHDILWEHIQDFFEKDSSKSVRLAPKLTQRHLDLPPFSRLRVRLAAQTLSHTVATGMKVLAQWDIIGADAEHTADFLENFDRLFNVFNSNSLHSTAKMRHAFNDTSGHREFLQEMLDWLKSLKYKGIYHLQFV